MFGQFHGPDGTVSMAPTSTPQKICIHSYLGCRVLEQGSLGKYMKVLRNTKTFMHFMGSNGEDVNQSFALQGIPQT